MDEEDVQTSPLARVGEACAMALGGSIVCALPTALRAHASGGGLLDAWLTAAAVMLCLFAPLAWLLPKAARGWRGVVGQSTPRKVLIGVALWVALTGAVLMLLATFLKARTRHRGLGGATFGVFGALSGVVIGVLVGRAIQIGEKVSESPRWRWPLRVGGGLVVALCLGIIGYPLLRGGDGAMAFARASMFDLLLAAVVVATLLPRRPPKALATVSKMAALPLALCIVVVGFVRVETSNTASFVRAGGGMVASLLGALEAWTDQDQDGVGSHFGGRDCDEGDPTMHPRATDAPGDGIDHDCDGQDGRVEVEVAVAPEPPAPVASSPPTTVTASAPKPPPSKPDIIVVTLDTVRADHTSMYGADEKITPTLAALASRGLVFEHAYAAGSDTQRALTPIISGTTISATPHTNVEWPRLRDEANTVAERMKAAGYATAGISSFTWVRGDRGFAQGFDVLDESAWSDRHPEREYTGDLAIDAAIKQYEKMAAGSAPLYLWVHLFDAHDKYVEHAGIHHGDDLSDAYDGELTFLDKQLARLVSTIDKSPRGKQTMWLVHGTHGEAFGEHGQTGHGSQLHDESIRVPLFVVSPWTQPGRYTTDAVSILDAAPTILDFAGASSKDTSGVSLRPAIEGKDFTREPVLAYANRRVAVIDWPLKLYVFRRKERRDRLLLYDLAQDPQEMKDRSADDKDALVRLDDHRREVEKTSKDD